jgi:hypothetical protein
MLAFLSLLGAVKVAVLSGVSICLISFVLIDCLTTGYYLTTKEREKKVKTYKFGPPGATEEKRVKGSKLLFLYILTVSSY